MDQIGYDTKEVWDKILTDEGSVQDLDFLDNWCFFKGKLIEKIDVPKNYEGTPFKDVFKTFKESKSLRTNSLACGFIIPAEG